ncbi:hypothetical protein QVD17_35836 [Tagetes erecta]|uniref:Uncharacterized protein n=1 Tax=Tagetes erecta TaxID=13708 RepID=A0AAD8JR79_TARER|nr:hypothetical protein QVD17_35836 [Tagetes erecta]
MTILLIYSQAVFNMFITLFVILHLLLTFDASTISKLVYIPEKSQKTEDLHREDEPQPVRPDPVRDILYGSNLSRTYLLGGS